MHLLYVKRNTKQTTTHLSVYIKLQAAGRKREAPHSIPLYTKSSSLPPFLENFTAMGFCMKTPSVIVKAMLLLFLVFLSTAETGAFARTMKPPTSGANTVYDPNSNRPVSPSGPNCTTYIPGGCGSRN